MSVNRKCHLVVSSYSSIIFYLICIYEVVIEKKPRTNGVRLNFLCKNRELTYLFQCSFDLKILPNV